MKKLKKWHIVSISLVVVILAGLTGLGFWLSKGKITQTKAKIYKVLPFPMALVNNHPLTMKNFLSRLDSAKVFYDKSGTKYDETGLEEAIANKMVDEEKINILAKTNNVSVKDSEINDEYSVRAKSADLEGKKNFEDLLKSYGLNTASFKSDVIRPDLLATNLVVWFNAQKNLNSDQYKLADDLMKKIESGQSMEDIASKFSQEDATKMTQGDLGFIEINGVLPELKETLDSMSAGQSKIAASRYGIHILKLEEKDNNGENNGARMHIKQIFIKPNDFEKWFKDETQNFKVKKIVKI